MLLLSALCLVGTALALPSPQDNLIDTIIQAAMLTDPLIHDVLGKRQLSAESDNLFDDILKAVQVATPIFTDLAGKRGCCFDVDLDLLKVEPLVASILASSNLAEAQASDESDNLFDDILKAVQVATPIVTALAGKREDNLIDDLLATPVVANPTLLNVLGKRQVADSEWFDTFLAAVEAATPTIVGVIQGVGTA